jgi:antirestriction protein ArdC
MKTDVYEKITTHIIAELEKGVRPWFKPWNAEHAAGRITRPLRGNGVPYRGVNVLMLWGAAMDRGYAAPIWLTFKQALDLGGHVRKGETGSLVVYANTFNRTDTDPDTGEVSERAMPFLKGYTVFNVEQVESLPDYHAVAAPILDPVTRNARAEAFFTATGATIRHGGDQTFYMPSADLVQMPPFPAFRDPVAYYATLAHEMTHWTKSPHRLYRGFGRKRFGDSGYAMEELVAELGAAFLCADLTLMPEPRPEYARHRLRRRPCAARRRLSLRAAAAGRGRYGTRAGRLTDVKKWPPGCVYRAAFFEALPLGRGRCNASVAEA